MKESFNKDELLKYLDNEKFAVQVVDLILNPIEELSENASGNIIPKAIWDIVWKIEDKAKKNIDNKPDVANLLFAMDFYWNMLYEDEVKHLWIGLAALTYYLELIKEEEGVNKL